MQFTTHDTNYFIDTNMTSLQGVITATYDQVVAKFGQPTIADEYKIDAIWEIEFANGTVATIYNWKNGKNYNGPDGMDVQDMTSWHVGGHDYHAFELVLEALNPVSVAA